MNFFFNLKNLASSMAAPITRLIRWRWLRTLVWSLAACLAIFFYGDSVRVGNFRPLEGDFRRLLACAVVIACWAGYNIYWWVKDRRANGAMISAITADGEANKADLSTQEIDRLKGRLQDALVQLRKMTGGSRRSYLYQLPWYVLIGPPGSGKTTALLNSGLKFPLAERMGRDPVAGVGGTRNCDWWFTEDAILLDTAGRYTTQDSDPEVDQKSWAGFLNLLKTYRPLQPINGVLVFVSLADVAGSNAGERFNIAASIRARIAELTRVFGSRFPIYVVLTKADLIAGFVQFFDAYSRGDREQVWGVTFPLDDGKPDTQDAVSRFDIEFDQLLTRMNAIVLERLQQETDVQRRGLIYGFPLQVAMLKEHLHELLKEIFSTSKFDTRPLLRGIYLTSSTQEGAPIDRLMHAMAVNFGMDAPRLTAFAGQEKSYFLTRLLDAVVFSEANVVAADPKLRRRLAMTRRLAGGVAAVVVVLLLGAWGLAYGQNKHLVETANQQIASYDKAVAGIPTANVSDIDFVRIVPPLNQLRDGPMQLRRRATAVWMHTGLDQSAKLQSQYSELYGRALNQLLLPRVLVFLQQRLRNGKTDDQDFKEAALKLYLSLGGQGPVDTGFARTFMSAAWASLYPDAGQAGLRADLDRHFAALLSEPVDTIALDASLIGDVRAQIGSQPLAARAYSYLRGIPEAQNLPSWTVADVGGAVADRAFARPSGKPLTEGIPGLYTRKGYIEVFLPKLKEAVEQASKDHWVFGGSTSDNDDPAVAATQAVALYRGDFSARWTALLTDLRVKPLTDMHQAVLVMTTLSGPDSVLRKLITSIVATTDLTPPGEDAKDPESQRIRDLFAASAGASGTEDDQLFQPLRDAMKASDGQPSQISELLRTLADLYAQLSKTENSPGNVVTVQQTASSLNDVNQRLLSEGNQLPSPVSVWLGGVATQISSVAGGATTSAILQAWHASGERFCTQAAAARYPFSRRSGSEISVDDFSHLFGPGGVMDQFFKENLAPFVNTSRHPWQFQVNSPQGVNSAFLSQFEHADAIKQAFFGTGSAASFHYDLSPDYLDPAANTMTLDVGGQTLTYGHGPVRPTTFTWPAPSSTGLRLDVEPEAAGGVINLPGVWAPFRLIDSGSVYNRTRDGFTVSILLSGRKVSFQVTSDVAVNPFVMRDLRQFSCPAGQ